MMTHDELVEDGCEQGFSVYCEGDVTVAAFEFNGDTYKLGFLGGDGKEGMHREALAFSMRASLRYLNNGGDPVRMGMKAPCLVGGG